MSFPQQNGALSTHEDEEEDELSAAELELAQARDRRRAKSLPAYPEHEHESALLLRALAHGCGKRVRFADALGLSLARVKHFSAAEEPRVPVYHVPAPPVRVPTLRTHEVELEARVRRCGLALETVSVSCGRVHGIIRVSATAAARAREVGVRYTLDEWRTYVDTLAVLVPSLVQAPGGESFAFTVCAPPRPDPSAAVHFALYLKTEGTELWDNNDGQNYTLRAGQLNNNSSSSNNYM
ncbi:protein phosphatase 1 regulatory subunit 3G [Hoplias malabaricus]|uniref:protein phosphatase 1 regulatory subunit 3G n=1 Tax=Hoplias malabaricus TaxID=27720 RepID=UPI0034624DEC